MISGRAIMIQKKSVHNNNCQNIRFRTNFEKKSEKKFKKVIFFVGQPKKCFRIFFNGFLLNNGRQRPYTLTYYLKLLTRRSMYKTTYSVRALSSLIFCMFGVFTRVLARFSTRSLVNEVAESDFTTRRV